MGVVTSSNTAATYSAIASQTISSGVATVDFTSIPSTYTDLVLVVNRLETSVNIVDIFLRANGDTGSNYSLTYLYGNGSAAGSGRNSNQTATPIAYTNADYPLIKYNIPLYSNTNTYKMFVGRWDAATNVTQYNINLWRSTAAINSLSIYSSSGNITGGTFTLYGIKGA